MVLRSNILKFKPPETAFYSLYFEIISISFLLLYSGNMIGIERSHKYVLLENGERVAYDYLMLCTGQQYQVCWSFKNLIGYLQQD